MPPITSSRLTSGYSDRISARLTTWTGRPKTLAMEALRLSSSMRSGRGREGDRAALAVAGRLAGLRLEPAIQLRRVARELRHVDALAQLTDEPRRMPGGAAGELLALDEHDVAPAELRQVIGDGAADDAAADDDDAGAGGKIDGHELKPSSANCRHRKPGRAARSRARASPWSSMSKRAAGGREVRLDTQANARLFFTRCP